MTGGASVDCSILVPVFDEERFIEPMVAAMRAQRFDGELEFVFADGGSSDRTREILSASWPAQDPRIRVFDNPRRTVSSGLNVALREARGTWVARMDGHTVYPADYVADGIARLERRRQQLDLRAPAGPRPQPGVPGDRAGAGVPAGTRRVEEMVPARPRPRRARPTSSNSTRGCSAGCGGARRSWTTEAGTSAGTRTRTPSWRRASCAAASGSSACPA